MDQSSKQDDNEVAPDHWTMIRDIALLQVKLVVDGLRDFILVPVSLVAGLWSLVNRQTSTDNLFYELLRTGKKSERWINLFGAADRFPSAEDDPREFASEDIDTLVSRVENFVVDEYRKGGVTRQAKDRFEKSIASLHNMASRRKR